MTPKLSEYTDMDITNLHKILEDQPKYRLKQAYQLIYANLISSWREATVFSPALRAQLDQECPLQITAAMEESSKDKSIKILITLADGKQVESVLMRHGDGRNTVCVSAQVGCPLGCKFCATGHLGFERNLDANEIFEQVLFFARWLKKKNAKVDNIVFMGMGEPFLNYDNIIKAIKILNDREGLNIGARHISISTVGLPDGIKRLSREPYQVNLAISLHAPSDDLRTKIIPANKNFNLKSVISAAKAYLQATNRQIMFEYLMIKGVNDSPAMADQLTQLLSELPKKLFIINLISYNSTDVYRPSETRKIEDFKKLLEAAHIRVTQRRSFGQDIAAACGQLAKKAKNGKI